MPVLVEVSPASLISGKWSSSHLPKSRASRADSKMNEGARCIASSITVVLTPPASRTSFIPRLYARDQRALGGRQRDVELALRVLAVDEQRAGHTERDLRNADEVLDVAGGQIGVERVAADVLQVDAGLVA